MTAVSSLEEEFIMAGLTFNTQASFVGVIAAAEALIGLVTGPDGITILGQGYSSTGKGVTVSLYEAAFTLGTNARTINRNLAGGPPPMTPKQGVSSVLGPLVAQVTFTAIATGNQAQLQLVQDFQRLVLKPSTSYVIGLKNNDTQAETIGANITWRKTQAATPR